MKLILATPHKRNDSLEKRLIEYGYCINRVYSPSELETLLNTGYKPDYIFFPHWSWIIPRAIFAENRCVIFHMTDLPYGRGGSPLQNLIVRGKENTKLSAIKCVEELDGGPVYLQRDLSLSGTAEDILLRASELMFDMIVRIVSEKIEPVEQVGDPVVFTRRSPEEGDISGLFEIKKVYDYIRMLDADGYPPAYADLKYLKVEFSEAKLCSEYVIAQVKIYVRDDE